MDRLTLNNNRQDPAHVKQCISYELMRKAGVPAPRCNFAEVTVITTGGGGGQKYHDIYTNVESIKDPFLRRNFGSDAGKLYEGTLSDFWSGPYRNTIEPKNPQAAADWTEVDALMAALQNNAMSDAARLTAIEGLVDLDSFLTFWAMEGLTGHWDGYADDQNNFWFYVNPVDGLIHFIPWGMDATLGPGNELTIGGRGGDPVHADPIVPRAALTWRLYQMPTVKADFIARMQWLLDNVFDETEVHAEIDRIEAMITPVAGNLTSELSPIRTWVDDHRAIVQGELDSPPSGFTAQSTHFCDIF
jgi:spore coat protein H